MQVSSGSYLVGMRPYDMKQYGMHCWQGTGLALREASFHDGKPDLYGLYGIKDGKPDTARRLLDDLEAAQRRRDRLTEGYALPGGVLSVYRQKIIFEHIE